MQWFNVTLSTAFTLTGTSEFELRVLLRDFVRPLSYFLDNIWISYDPSITSNSTVGFSIGTTAPVSPLTRVGVTLLLIRKASFPSFAA